MRKHQAVADALHLSLSTYQRCLNEARHMLTTALWEAECDLRRAAPESPHRASPRHWHWGVFAVMVLLLAITGTLAMRFHLLDVHSKTVIVNRPIAVNAEAWDDYRTGLQYLEQPSAPALKQAVAFFQKSIAADKNNAHAWAALAMAYVMLRQYGDDVSPDTYYAEGLAAASKALAINPSTVSAHVAVAVLRAQHNEWSQAQHEYQLALALDPMNARAHEWHAMYYWYTGNPRRALTEIQVAQGADPPSAVINLELVRGYVYAGKSPQAITQLRNAIILAPGSGLLYFLEAQNDLNTGHYRQALRAAKQAARMAGNPDAPLPLMEQAIACVGLGRMNQARLDLAKLQRLSARRYVSNLILSRVLWSIGEKDQAFLHLQQAVQDHDQLTMLLSGPDWSGVRADPRFADIRKLMNLPAH